MIRPSSFMFNQETAVTNHYQDGSCDTTDDDWKQVAMEEFDIAVDTLRSNKIKVTVIQDSPYFVKPDAVFPNNWISIHKTGELVLYPMATSNRRLERRQDIIQWFKDNFKVKKMVDLTNFEAEDKYLEGTGSIVFDYEGKVAYACESVRTNAEVLKNLCSKINYEPLIMQANDKQGRPIYHTNVFMSLTTRLAIICMEAVQGEDMRLHLEARLTNTGRRIVNISQDQVESLAGNCYEVMGEDNKLKLVISTRAWSSLSSDQKRDLEAEAEIVCCNVDTIERVGGGGIRCMMAGIFADRV